MIKQSFWNIIITLKNNQIVKKSYVIIKKKKKIINLLNILWDENYISGYCFFNKHYIKIFLKYIAHKPVLLNFKFISKPGKKLYLSVKHLWKLKIGSNNLILSTTKGFLTLNSCKKINVGGKPLLLIY